MPNLLIYVAGFFIVSCIALLPLLLIRKTSCFYTPVWSAYALGALLVILTAIWKIMNFQSPKNSQDGFPMSPIGDATAEDLMMLAGVILSIIITSYLFTIGLPWAFKNWPPGTRIKKYKQVGNCDTEKAD